jgi:hypothetical protein
MRYAAVRNGVSRGLKEPALIDLCRVQITAFFRRELRKTGPKYWSSSNPCDTRIARASAFDFSMAKRHPTFLPQVPRVTV